MSPVLSPCKNSHSIIRALSDIDLESSDSNQVRKEAEQLLKSLKERKEDMDKNIIKLKKQVQELNAVKTNSQQLEEFGNDLASKPQNLSKDARAATFEIQCLKERTSQFAEQFSGLRSKTVDPLLYCQTRQCVLKALDEAFHDIKALPMAEQLRSITLDVKDRLIELHEADPLMTEWERIEREKVKETQLRKQERQNNPSNYPGKKAKAQKERLYGNEFERVSNLDGAMTYQVVIRVTILGIVMLVSSLFLGWLCIVLFCFLWDILLFLMKVAVLVLISKLCGLI